MNRRSLLAGVGLSASSAIVGCLDESDEEIRRRACSHAPDEADQVSHNVTQTRFHFLREQHAPLTLVTEHDQIAPRIDPGQREHGDVDALFEGVSFDEHAILVWEATEHITTDNVEFLGVTRPTDQELLAYGCDYRLGGGGQEETNYSFVITVRVDETPRQAELRIQNEGGETRTLTTAH
ncbi:hypothetical protein [Natronosalvus rutilus]|uniref:Lipoprotein n=1 Tax=Natronosalvus rutilus TaxID=2953753 RepID=A0A9E7NA28_9EURY|nr:hypothetical protein [Natronosalvus rutilus]UTF53596.1 hypothetical protein NGM29_17800 [Natronosalvus rutilus]